MNDLIRDRDERTRRRKKTKRKMDSIIGLSYSDEQKHGMRMQFEVAKLSTETIRLLDEGYFDNGFVIKKGTLEKYLKGQNEYVRGWELGEDGWEATEVLNLSDDFVGTVNLGHMDFATFPFIIGEFRKSDLSLVDIENDRKGIDVKLNLDEESMFVKELKRQPYDIGISSEFWYHVNEEDTESLSEMLGYYMPVIDEVFIFAYGLVGECGNVNSSGLELAISKGDNMEKEILSTVEVEEAIEETIEAEDIVEESIAELDAEIETEEEIIAEPEEEALDPVLDAVEEIVEEIVEQGTEPMEESAEEVTEAEELAIDSEEAEVEEVIEEESDDDEDESDETDELEQVLSVVNTLKETVATLTSQVAELTETNEQLKKSNRRLQNKLQTEKDKKEKFLESTKNLSVQLLPNEDVKPKEQKVTHDNYLFGDGIGEL